MRSRPTFHASDEARGTFPHLSRRARRRGPGQNLVEFALILPLLILVLFGVIDLARLLHAKVTVTNSARQAIRFAITGQQLKDSSGAYIPRATSIISKSRESLVGLQLTGTDDPTDYGFYRIELQSRKLNGNVQIGDPGGPREAVEVKVTYNVQMLTPLLSAVLPRVMVSATEGGINEEWGAVQSFDHAVVPPLPPPLATWTPYPTRTPTRTPTIAPPTNTPTRTATSTPTGTVTPTRTVVPTGTSTPAAPSATPTRAATASATATRSPSGGMTPPLICRAAPLPSLWGTYEEQREGKVWHGSLDAVGLLRDRHSLRVTEDAQRN